MERLRGAYEAFNEGGVDAILERLSPDFQVRDRQTSPDRETRYGREGIKQLFDSYMEAFDALRLEPEEFIDAGDQVVVSLHQHVRGKGSGAEVVGEHRTCLDHARGARRPRLQDLRGQEEQRSKPWRRRYSLGRTGGIASWFARLL